MHRTRRKAALEAEQAAEQNEESSDSSTLHVELPDDLDADVLSGLAPDIDFATLSSDAVITLCRILVSQSTEVDSAQRELEETRAEVERKDVELDQALQDRETNSKYLEAQVETLQAELIQTKAERDQLSALKSVRRVVMI
jgi:nucleoprotein TPR